MTDYQQQETLFGNTVSRPTDMANVVNSKRFRAMIIKNKRREQRMEAVKSLKCTFCLKILDAEMKIVKYDPSSDGHNVAMITYAKPVILDSTGNYCSMTCHQMFIARMKHKHV